MEKQAAEARRAAKLSIVATSGMIAVEATVGLVFSSIALVADAIDKVVDIASTSVVLLGLVYALRPPDVKHPYGHAKLENLTSLVVGSLILVSAFIIGSEAIRRVVEGPTIKFSFFLLFVAVASVFTNYFLARYKRRVGEKTSSSSLVADAHNSMSDMYASVAVVVGLLAVAFQFPLGDPIGALAVLGLIALAAVRIFRGAYPPLLDTSPGEDYALRVKRIAERVEGVVACHAVRARDDGRAVHLDMHIEVQRGTKIEAAHNVAHAVETEIKRRLKEVGTIIIHTEPPLADREEN